MINLFALIDNDYLGCSASLSLSCPGTGSSSDRRERQPQSTKVLSTCQRSRCSHTSSIPHNEHVAVVVLIAVNSFAQVRERETQACAGRK